MDDKNTNKGSRRWILENIVSFAIAFFIVFMVRSSVFEAFKIPSGSMIPTLLVGDHIFVNKFSYAFKIPFSDLTWPSLGIEREPVFISRRPGPKRGDVVVFLFPKDKNFYFIKRIVGLPGDTIEVKDKNLWINGIEIKKDLVTGKEAEEVFSGVDDPRFSAQNLSLYREHLDGVDHWILHDRNNFGLDKYGPFKIPDDQYFVMGDNRDFSNDSRFWGTVPFNAIKGKAMVVWLSFWLSFTDEQNSFKPKRTGLFIQ